MIRPRLRAGELLRYLADRRATNMMTAPMLAVIAAPFALFAAEDAGAPAFWIGVGLTAAAGFAVYVAALMLNDVCDLEVDRLAHPERPLPSGRCSPEGLTGWAWALYGLAGLVAALWSWPAAVVVALHLAVSVGHYSFTKTRLRAPGSSELLTALQNAPIPLFGATMALPLIHDLSPHVPLILGLTLLVYCADAATDMIAGIADEAADFIGNVATVSVGLGARAAALGGAAMAAAALATGAWVLGRAGAPPVVQAGGLLSGLAVLATLGWLLPQPERERRIERAYLALWVFVIWIFVATAIAAVLSRGG